jgi:hypothetical protein
MENLNIEYDKISPNTNKNVLNKDGDILRSVDNSYFVICNSCYWCASYFEIDGLKSSQTLGCHVCNSCNTELIPIPINESFRIKYNVTRGMEMEFYRNNEIVDRQQESPEQQIMPV